MAKKPAVRQLVLPEGQTIDSLVDAIWGDPSKRNLLSGDTLIETLIEAFGGASEFVKRLKEDYDNSKPGSTVRTRLGHLITTMFERYTIRQELKFNLDQYNKEEIENLAGGLLRRYAVEKATSDTPLSKTCPHCGGQL